MLTTGNSSITDGDDFIALVSDAASSVLSGSIDWHRAVDETTFDDMIRNLPWVTMFECLDHAGFVLKLHW